jgi:hypothetical protein
MANTITDSTLPDMINKITYSKLKITNQGAKYINLLNMDTNKNLRLNTPFMHCYGATDYEGNGKFSAALQFSNDSDSNEDAFLKNMIELENQIKSDCLLHSIDWFGKQLKSSAVVDAVFSPMLKYPKMNGSSEFDTSRKPTIKIKLNKFSKWNFELYDEQSRLLFPEEDEKSNPSKHLPCNCKVKCIIECASIYIINGKISVTWKLVQAMVKDKAESIFGKCHLQND